MSFVLVVEDEPTIRSNLQRLLGIEGFTVDGAENGAEALKCIAARKPDLVLSDITMPVLDGYGLLAAMRADPAM